MKKLFFLLFFIGQLHAQTLATSFVKYSGGITRTGVQNSTGLTFDSTVYISAANGSVTNAQLAGSIAYSKLILTGAILNADLAGSIDLTTKVTGVLPIANGGELRNTATTSATTGTMTVTMNTLFVTITPTNACTFNASGGTTGQTTVFVITTSGASSFTLTWGTNYKTTGTLATGTTTAKKFCVTFLCLDGTTWLEVARTTAM